MKANGQGAIQETAFAVGSDATKIDRLLTVEDLAGLLKVPLSWIYDHTRKRALCRLPGLKLGKYWRFRETDIVTWLERQRKG